MKLGEQVTNVVMSKKLKKLGIPQHAVWCWIKPRSGSWKLVLTNPHSVTYAAFTVAELGELLPTTLVIQEEPYQFYARKSQNEWIVQYRSRTNGLDAFVGISEADARAKMLIYFYEHDLLTTTNKNLSQGESSLH